MSFKIEESLRLIYAALNAIRKAYGDRLKGVCYNKIYFIKKDVSVLCQIDDEFKYLTVRAEDKSIFEGPVYAKVNP